MAGARFSVAQSDIALVAATAKNVLIYTAPATHRSLLRKWWVDFISTLSGDNHVLIEVYRATGTPSDGTDISTNAAPVHEGNPTAPVGVFRHSVTAGLTLGKRIEVHRWHPTSGEINEEALGEEIVVAPGASIVVRCTAPQAQTVTPGMRVEE